MRTVYRITWWPTIDAEHRASRYYRGDKALEEANTRYAELATRPKARPQLQQLTPHGWQEIPQ